MPHKKVDYGVSLTYPNSGHLMLVNVVAELNGIDNQRLRIFEGESVREEVYNRIIFGVGSITLHLRRRS